MTDLSKLAQSLGGIKSQQKHLRERVDKLNGRMKTLESKVNIILLIVVLFCATMITGSLLR